METISVSALKAHLSAELRRVKAGEELVVVEHRRPVAVLRPYDVEPLLLREPSVPYAPVALEPLTTVDPIAPLLEERDDRW